MSDPVTNVEIEDVLSSIRRLVSSDGQAGRESAERASDAGTQYDEEAAAAPKPAEPKLVLTPAQRVNDTPQFVTAREEAPAPRNTSLEDHETSDETAAVMKDVQDILENDVADLSDRLGSSEAEHAPEDMSEDASDDWAQDLADEASDDEPEDEPHDASDETEEMELAPDTDHQDDQDHDHSDDPEDAAWAEIEAEAEVDAEADVEVVASDDTQAVEDLTLESMADSDVPEFLRRPTTQMNPPEDAEILETTTETNAERFPDHDEVEALQDQNAPKEDEPVTLSAKLESLEAAVSDQAEEWEPDEGDQESLSATEVEPLPWHDIEAETAEMPEPELAAQPVLDAEPQADVVDARAVEEDLTRDTSEPGQDPEDEDSWFADDALLDEEALRDMVGEIVRQELQGALGERITRNVRKLVRREIHRALVSKGIE